jgi:hypothetical protein
VPIAGRKGYHRDDWESVQFRIRPDGSVDQRTSSHNGYNHSRGAANWGSDAGVKPVNGLAEALGARPRNGWGSETGIVLVSGGSHAGNAAGFPDFERLTVGRDVHLVPLEPIAEAALDPTGSGARAPRFAVSPPWWKRVWRDPEANGTN